MKKFAPYLLYAMLTLALLVSLAMDQRQRKEFELDLINTQGPPPAIGSVAPEFRAAAPDGSIVTNADLAGQRYLLVLWENSSVSKNLLRGLDSYHQDVSHPVPIIPVNIAQRPQEAAGIFAEEGISLPALTDDKKTTRWAYNASRVPAVYLVDESGLIVLRQSGYSEAALNSILARIKQ